MADYRRLVVKLGTSVLTGGGDRLDSRRLLEIVRQVAALSEQEHEVLLVTSGAMAAGRELLDAGLTARNLPLKQMLCAIGQPRLMHIYADLFALFGRHVAQVLLTRQDFRQRRSYLNARDTLQALLDHGVIPIINENDTVSTAEIRLGDNDNLSALVANLIDADLLMLLTDQPGLFTTDPRTDPHAQLIREVRQFDPSLWEAAGGAGSAQGTGGMITKLQAAQLATRSGTAVVIAQGSRPNVLLDLVGSEAHNIGTWFAPQETHIESRKRWLLSEDAKGRIVVDEGAALALRQGRASLLPAGVIAVAGEFERGVVVSVCNSGGDEILRGLVNYDSRDLDRLCGVKSDQIETLLGYTYGPEVIHRDHLVLVAALSR